MPAFQFPDPALEQTVVNPITGSTYQWQDPPGKWVVTAKLREVSDIIWEGDDEPNPNPGDYKLWYHTDKLELYFWYEDINGVGAWVPTSAPITMIEELDEGLFKLQEDVKEINAVVNENVDRIERTVWFGENPPTIYADNVFPNQNIDADGNITPILDDDGNPTFITEKSALNYQFWLKTDTGKLYVLRVDEGRPEGYSYSPINTDNSVTLQEVLENGNIADLGAVFGEPVSVGFDEFDPQEAHAVPFGYYDGGQSEQNDAIKEMQDSLIVLQQEIEKLSQTQDSGKWMYNQAAATPRSGQFTMSNSSGLPSNAWADSTKIIVNTTDVGMEVHSFDTWEEGDTIEIFNATTGTYALYTLGQYLPDTEAFGLKELQRSKGAPINNAEYEIRVFKLSSGINFEEADARYLIKSGDTITGQMNLVHPSRTTQTWFNFLNSQKANQAAEIRVQRPYDGDGGSNADGSTNAKGTGGLDIKLMANSDGNRLRILGGSGGATETVRIGAGGGGKQVTVNSSIQLGGGADHKQVIWAKQGVAGHLSYKDTNDDARRISWGDSKVWIRNATLDMTNNNIINVPTADSGSLNNVANVEFVIKQIEDALKDASFDNYVKKDGDVLSGDYDMTTKTSNGFRINGNFKVKKTNQGLTGSNCFFVDGEGATYAGKTTSSSNIITKGYADTNHYTKTYTDNNFVKGKFKITNSGGNYYIEPS